MLSLAVFPDDPISKYEVVAILTRVNPLARANRHYPDVQIVQSNPLNKAQSPRQPRQSL